MHGVITQKVTPRTRDLPRIACARSTRRGHWGAPAPTSRLRPIGIRHNRAAHSYHRNQRAFRRDAAAPFEFSREPQTKSETRAHSRLYSTFVSAFSPSQRILRP